MLQFEYLLSPYQVIEIFDKLVLGEIVSKMQKIEDHLVRTKFKKCLGNHKRVTINDSLEQIRERRLPKILFDDSTKPIIDKVNEILSEEISVEDLTIDKLHTLVCCGARTVVELCQENQIKVYTESEIPKEFPKSDEKEQKELYKISPQRFRRLLFRGSIKINEGARPSEEGIKEFWSNVWKKKEDSSDQEREDQRRDYLRREEKRVEKGKPEKVGEVSVNSRIKMKDLKRILKKSKNWSPPGIDGVQFFWYKKLKPARKALVQKINRILNGSEEIPKFFTVGFTELLPKNEDTENPSNYRPITHLPAIYKIITKCVYEKIFFHYKDNRILADEQCGGRKGFFGVRKALVMDSVALDHKPVYGSYVDFVKAFDSVSHEWILELLEVYGVDVGIRKFLKVAMGNWKTRIYLAPDILTNAFPLEKGIFHGDPISVILFWTVVNPLSFVLQDMKKGLELRKGGGTLSHLFYMDDLKLYASEEKNFKEMIEEVKRYSRAINMDINESKSSPFCITDQKVEGDKVYLGYIQKPTINNNETIYHKVRRFEERFKIAQGISISDEDKKGFIRKFLFTSIFNTFGVLHWRAFKRNLAKAEVGGKFLESIKKNQSLDGIYLKLINDMCKMRRGFYEDKEKSELIKNIIENDTVSPLKLSQLDEKEYVDALVATMGGKPRKRKSFELTK